MIDRTNWQRKEYRNQKPGLDGLTAMEFDIPSGRAFITARGIWSPTQVTDFAKDWSNVVAAMHSRGKSPQVLVDLCEAVVQPSDVAEATDGSFDLYREGDRIALVVPSVLMKAQLRRVLDQKFHTFFTDRHEAERWLWGN